MSLASSTVLGIATASTFLFASFKDSTTPSGDGCGSLMATVVWTSGMPYEGPIQNLRLVEGHTGCSTYRSNPE
ncbi:hypothetical protein JB92DRAFT_2898991, partial [Gautieria morchelliformis]